MSDWTLSTNHSGNTAVTVRSDDFVSAGYSLYTYLDAPPGGNALFTRATHAFNVGTAGDYTLDLWARSSPCQGCTISYEVFVDNVNLTTTFATSFEARSFALTGLSTGSHDLTLGIFITNASSGRFNASFDDVMISWDVADAPEPGSFLLMGAAAMLRARRWRRRKPNTDSDSRS